MRPPFPSIVDNTMLNTFRSCPRKFELQYLRHWKLTGSNVHLNAGAAFAKGLEDARKTYYELDSGSEAAIMVGVRSLIEAYGDFECPPESAKSCERMVTALEYYFDAFPFASDAAKPIKLPSGAHAIEFSFAQPIIDFLHPETREPLIYSGRADMVVDMANGIFVMDDKTTSQLGASWANQWEMRSQFTGYCWAAKLAGLPVDGVLVRGIAILKTKFNHAQSITYRPDWEIERWYQQTLRDLARMRDCWERGEFDYNLGEACNEYGGCVFVQICKKSNPDDWLDAYFHQRVWNPLTRSEEPLHAKLTLVPSTPDFVPPRAADISRDTILFS